MARRPIVVRGSSLPRASPRPPVTGGEPEPGVQEAAPPGGVRGSAPPWVVGERESVGLVGGVAGERRRQVPLAVFGVSSGKILAYERVEAVRDRQRSNIGSSEEPPVLSLARCQARNIPICLPCVDVLDDRDVQ